MNDSPFQRSLWPRLILAAVAGIMGLALALVAQSALTLSGLDRLILEGDSDFSRRYIDPTPIRFDPELGWAPIPGFHGRIDSGGMVTMVTNNGLGFRSSELDPNRDKIVILGDSVAWGWGGADRDSFPSRLQEKLAGTPLQVVNMAVPGYGPDQEYLWLKRKWASLPGRRKVKMVVLVICAFNDLQDVSIPFNEGRISPHYRLLHDGRMVLTSASVRKYGLTNLLCASVIPEKWKQRLLRAANPPLDDADGKIVTERLLRQMQSLAEASGARFAVVLSPWEGNFQGPRWPRWPEFREQQFVYDWFRQMLANQPFSSLDYKSIMSQKQAPLDCYLGDGVHYNAAGNELLARTVHERLVSPQAAVSHRGLINF